MPVKDQNHDTVIRTLRKDGWTITREQVYLAIGRTEAHKRRLFIDLEARKDQDHFILVEVKRLSPSPVHQLMQLLGQYYVYRAALDELSIATPLYVAVDQQTYRVVFQSALGQIVTKQHPIPLVVYDSTKEEIVRWIPQP